MAETLVIRLAANALGEDVQDMIAFLEESYPVREVQREAAQVMVKFKEDVDEEEANDALSSEFREVISGELEWM